MNFEEFLETCKQEEPIAYEYIYEYLQVATTDFDYKIEEYVSDIGDELHDCVYDYIEEALNIEYRRRENEANLEEGETDEAFGMICFLKECDMIFDNIYSFLKKGILVSDNVIFIQAIEKYQNLKVALEILYSKSIYRYEDSKDEVKDRRQWHQSKKSKEFRDYLTCIELKKDEVINTLKTDISSNKRFAYLIEALMRIGLITIMEGEYSALHKSMRRCFGNIYTYSKFIERISDSGFDDKELKVINDYKKKYSKFIK